MARWQLISVAAAALLAGCGGSEAKRFGYKGADLEESEPMFFTTSPTVTNWVPARVLSVVESYDISPEEAKLVSLAGVVSPGEPLTAIPEGYVKAYDEPWFVTWTREAENFGKKGVNGFISHFDEERSVWETSETYFSSYWPDRASATAALKDLRAAISAECAPKKFYDFTDCWVAEYLRMRVMGLIGQKPDGTWSCMLDIQDKNRPGCGQWESPESQAGRRAEYVYRKELAAWKATKDKVVAGNHAKIDELRKGRSLGEFGDEFRPYDADDGRKVYVTGGAFDMTNIVREAVWQEKLSVLETAAGCGFDGEVERREADERYSVWSASWKSDLYELRLDMAFPNEGEKGEWRGLCFEVVQDGFEIPPRPRPPQL